jgi:hypothetical protein
MEQSGGAVCKLSTVAVERPEAIVSKISDDKIKVGMTYT